MKHIVLKIDGKSICEFNSVRIEAIKRILTTKEVKLSDVAVGETAIIGGYEFIVLEHTKETTHVISRFPLLKSVRFGKFNNYNGSVVDAICNGFAAEIAETVGSKNIVEHTVDLTSDEGLDNYGKIRRKMSSLTCDIFRKYVQILNKYEISKWWWLATPYNGGNAYDWIKCASPYGYIGNGRNDYCAGIRPYCILKSNIIVDKHEEVSK